MHAKAVKVGLIIVLLAVIVITAWNFVHRRRQIVAIPEGKLLPAQINRRTTQFEYSEKKRGRTVFHVRAEISTELAGGVHTLSNVQLTRYDLEGKPADTVSGEKAVYEVEKHQLQFSDNVEIELADKTRIFSERTRADLRQEVIHIDDNFRFELGEGKGKGESLTYRIPRKELDVMGRFELTLPALPSSVRVQARRARYRVSEQQIDLAGEARILGPEGWLTGDRMEIFLTGKKQIQKVVTVGQARLQLPMDQAFSGDRINVFFDPDLKRIDHFEVLGRPRASYEQRVAAGVHYLEAEKIRGILAASATRLRQLVAQRRVFFRSSALQVEEARADEFRGSFLEESQELKDIELKGKVSLVRSIHDPLERRTERLRSQFLRMQFLAGEKLDRATASGNVHAELNSPGEYRHLFARKSVEMGYRNGILKKLVGRKDCLLESRNLEGEKVLRAPLIHARFQAGKLEQATAEGGTVLELREQGTTRYATSERLDVFYKENKPFEAVQSGRFHFWVEGNSSSADLKAERAVYRFDRGKMTVTGKQAPVLQHSETETFADRFSLDRRTGKISAFENVRSVLWQEGTVVTATRMEVEPDTGRVDYFGNPRILRNGTAITGRRMRVHGQAEQIIVEEDVESVLTDGTQEDEKNYWIAADRLVYEHQQQVARYQGRVRTKTEDLVVEAPLVDVFFGAGSAAVLREVVFQGRVAIQQRDRTAQGQRAVYYPSEEKVVITGNPARVVEPERGQSSGQKLTFYVHNNRMLVEGPAVLNKKP